MMVPSFIGKGVFMEKLRLNTAAVCSWPSGRNESLNVELFWKDNVTGVDIVLRIVDTPGEWYLSQLLGDSSHPRDRISIDYGAHWVWENPDEVLKEARRAGQFMILSREFNKPA
jgi:hypothetical protein